MTLFAPHQEMKEAHNTRELHEGGLWRGRRQPSYRVGNGPGPSTAQLMSRFNRKQAKIYQPEKD